MVVYFRNDLTRNDLKKFEKAIFIE